ncbi:uncharacterized protein LOC105844356 isoform X1 [Hydra vulgaris]|uniref:uncharacterized protein LOC105844356 isoform X1 n=1 Tax=Hydra vulgaris TaxID=6087 RepID=UPI000640E726|nr:T-complex protein 1 subunit alpha [Hydra vulgaris]XP_047132257.1 T-complex protein 1 subunit alpha [Hydra vulgaris]
MVIGISLASDILQELDYLLEPSIGPCGKEVLLKSNTGTLFSTSNGCSILRHLNFSHPVGTMIKSSADKFILKYGDSSKSFIIFLSGLIRSFCKLLQNCLKKVEMLSDVSQFLLKMRELYSFEIMRTSSYNEGLLLVLPANDLPSNFLRGIFDSFMSGKFNCETKEFLFGICQGIIDSFQFSRTSLRFLVDNFDNICIPLCGISFTQSQCLEGVIVQKESFPKQVNISECFFILISGKLKRSKLNSFETCLNEKFTVEMREAEKYTFFQQLVSTLKENNIRLIFFEEQVPKSFQMLLELSDIVYVPYTQSCDLKRLAMLYKISVISGLYDIFNIDNKTCIGKANWFRSCILGRYTCCHLGPSADSNKYLQVLLCNISEGVCYEYASALKNFFLSLLSTFFSEEECYLVPSCGSFELTLAQHILSSSGQFNTEYLKIVADSLINLPRILISNSHHVSKSVILNCDVISSLKEKHYAVDGLTGKIVLSNSIHLYESFISKCSMFSSVLELCAQIVRIEIFVPVSKELLEQKNLTDSG